MAKKRIIIIKKQKNNQLPNLAKLLITYLAENNYSNTHKILFQNESMINNKHLLHSKEARFDYCFQELHQRKNFFEALKKV